MTNEKRQKLCDKLRVYGKSSFHGGRACKDAADEIERLAKENEELKKTQLKFRTVEPQPFIIRDEPVTNKELKKSLHHLHSARETDMGVAE